MVVLCDGLNCKYQFVLNKNQNQLEKYQVFEHDDMNDILLTLLMTESIRYLGKLP